jgi:hypothetical protein
MYGFPTRRSRPGGASQANSSVPSPRSSSMYRRIFAEQPDLEGRVLHGPLDEPIGPEPRRKPPGAMLPGPGQKLAADLARQALNARRIRPRADSEGRSRLGGGCCQ